MANALCEIPVRGMVCRACADEIETALLQTRGVVTARVRYFKHLAVVEYDPAIVTEADLEGSIAEAGYEAGRRGVSGILADVGCLILTALLVWLMMTSPLNPVPEARADAPLGYLFVIGLLTSTHCVAMCGGILLGTTGGSLRTRRSATVAASCAYNGGRLVSYTVMGAVFGALGRVLTYTMSFKSMVFTLVGLLVALIGLQMWGLLPGLGALAPEQNGACALPGGARRRFAGRPLLIGLLTGLMPCGALYAMWLVAMASGGAFQGALKMLAFTAGTVPLMALFGTLGAWLNRKWNKYLRRLGSMLVTAMGVKMLLMGLKMLEMTG